MKKIKIDNNDIDWAIETATKKVNYTYDSWKKRSVNQRFMDIFVGDLAKNIIKKEILSLYPKMKDFLKEYDIERVDNFKENDKYDLKIEFNGKSSNLFSSYSVEVKSSFEKYENKNIKKIENNRNIIVNKKSPHESFSDFVSQVFYIPKDLQWYKNFSDGKYNDIRLEECKKLIKRKIEKEVDIYICGFICYNEIKFKEETFSVENKSKNDQKRNYLKFSLKEAHPFEIFKSTLKEYHTLKLKEKNKKNCNNKIKSSI